MDVEASTSKAHPSSGEDNQQEDSNTPSPGKPILDDFLQTGRTGRRNALPDILDKDSSHDNTADLPCQMEKLSCSDSSQKNQQQHNGGGSTYTNTDNQNK